VIFLFLINFYSLDKVSFCHKENVTEKVICKKKKKLKRQNTSFPHFSVCRGEIFVTEQTSKQLSSSPTLKSIADTGI